MFALGLLGIVLSFLATATATATNLPGFITYESLNGNPYSVTYNNRSLLINGSPTILLGGSIHYPRLTPAQWEDAFKKAKLVGLNHISTYFFWNSHQHKPGEWSFAFETDIHNYLDLAAQYGLFVTFRIGPYVCGEWNYGGFPLWLSDPASIGGYTNMTTRSSSVAWKEQMQTIFVRIVTELRRHFADQGGPIILSQVENEYAEWACAGALGACDEAYISWWDILLASVQIPVPVVACNGHVSNTTVSACDGNDCTSYLESGGNNGKVFVTQPGIWTENEMWFDQWGQKTGVPAPTNIYAPPARSPQDLSFTVARWFARGGSAHSYYMLAGGNNFKRNAAGGVATAYANGAIFASDMLPNQQLHDHMANLHQIIALSAGALVSHPAQIFTPVVLDVWNTTTNTWMPGTNHTLGFMYSTGESDPNGVYFLEYTEVTTTTIPSVILVRWPGGNGAGGVSVNISSNSMQILAGITGTVLFDTMNVPPVTSARSYTPIPTTPWTSWLDTAVVGATTATTATRKKFSPGSTVGTVITANVPYEQLNVTEDDTEYLVYATGITASQLSRMLNRGSDATKIIQPTTTTTTTTMQMYIDSQLSQAFIVFINGIFVGHVYNNSHNFPTTKSTGMYNGSCSFSFPIDVPSVILTQALNQEGTPGVVQKKRNEVKEEDDDEGAVVMNLTILSESIGLDNGHGAWIVNGKSFTMKGLFSSVSLNNVSLIDGGSLWTMTSGLGGEALEVYTAAGGSQVSWTPVTTPPSPSSSVMWYRTFFSTPSNFSDATTDKRTLTQKSKMTMTTMKKREEVEVSFSSVMNVSLLVDIGPNVTSSSVNRGHVYVNGFDLGRYWNIVGFNTSSPGQRFYTIPQDILVPTGIENGNTLVLFDVLPLGDVRGVQIVMSQLV